jgi:hypothetical protein
MTSFSVSNARQQPLRVRHTTQPKEVLWDGAVRVAWIFMVSAVAFPIFRLVLGDGYLPLLNVAIGLIILVTCIWACVQTVLKCEGSLFTSIPWYYLAVGIYFGLGSLVYYFSDSPTQQFVQEASHYPIDELGIFESNVLNLLGIGTCALGMIFARFLYSAVPVTKSHMAAVGRTERRVFYIFLILGLLIKVGLTLPAMMGSAAVVLPGMLQQLEMLVPAALMIGIILVRNGAADLRPALYAGIAFLILSSFALASKTAIISSILMLIIADYVSRPRPLRAAVFGGLLFALYSVVLAPLVLFMRGFTADGDGTSFSKAYDAISKYWQFGNETPMFSDGVQIWWARLAYNNIQKFGIDQYNGGHPGNSLDEMYFILLPRIFFPDKPVLNSGKELSELLSTGSSDWVQTGMSVFAEGYWNWGYSGTLFVAFWMGLCMYFMSAVVTRQLAQARLGMLFVAVGVIQIGWYVTGAFAGTYVGGAALILVYAVFVKVLFYMGHRGVENRAAVGVKRQSWR